MLAGYGFVYLHNIIIKYTYFYSLSDIYCDGKNLCVFQAKEESLKNYPVQRHPRGLMTTTLGLNLPLDAETVLNGAVRVRCVAIVSAALWSSDKEKVLPRQDKREALLLGK